MADFANLPYPAMVEFIIFAMASCPQLKWEEGVAVSDFFNLFFLGNNMLSGSVQLS